MEEYYLVIYFIGYLVVFFVSIYGFYDKGRKVTGWTVMLSMLVGLGSWVVILVVLFVTLLDRLGSVVIYPRD